VDLLGLELGGGTVRFVAPAGQNTLSYTFYTAGGWLRGSGHLSGTVYSLGPVPSVTVGGSVRGGTGRGSGGVNVSGPVGAVLIGGNLAGGSASGTADLSESGAIIAFRIARLTIGGSLIAGTDDTTGTFRDNGAIQVLDNIGSVLIEGSIVGNPTNPATITAGGWLTPGDVDIGRLTVLGRVEHALIQAGLYLATSWWTLDTGAQWWTFNPDAQIGAVSVGGDWIASSLAAGADPGANGFFGDADDAKMVSEEDDPRVSSRVASWTVGGKVAGTPGGTDHYGVVADLA